MKTVTWTSREWAADVTQLNIYRADPTIEPAVIDPATGDEIEPEKEIPAVFDSANMPAAIATVDVNALSYDDIDGVQGSLYRIAPVGIFP